MIAIWLGWALANPHGQPDQCLACHTGTVVEVGAPRFEACVGCHPDADMHPVGMTPEHVQVAKGWPLDDGKMTCATCHAEPSCEPGRMSEPPYWRGGPAERLTDFCYRCHEREAMQRVDPHHGGCAACHITVRPVQLVAQPNALCSQCHTGPGHAGAAQHVGKPVDVAVGLPLVEGRIACITCHDVHDSTHATLDQDGLGAAIRARALEQDWKDMWTAPSGEHPPLLARPVADSQLCRTCHGEGP